MVGSPSPRTDGQVERMNRTIKEARRPLLPVTSLASLPSMAKLLNVSRPFWPSRSKSYSRANKTVPSLEWLNAAQTKEHSG